MSTPILLATSPAACPPMPSQTTKIPSWVSYPKLSSLLVRTQPTSLLPDTSILKLIRSPMCSERVCWSGGKPFGKPHISEGIERFCGFYWGCARVGKRERANHRYQLLVQHLWKTFQAALVSYHRMAYNRALRPALIGEISGCPHERCWVTRCRLRARLRSALKPQPFRKVLFRSVRAQTISAVRGYQKQRMAREAASEFKVPGNLK